LRCGWSKITISGKFADYSLREGSCTDENIVKTVRYDKMLNEVSLAFEIDKKADLTESIKKVDQSSLSAADAAYYLEVTSRVTKKLAELQ
jgi:hypothetical protein